MCAVIGEYGELAKAMKGYISKVYCDTAKVYRAREEIQGNGSTITTYELLKAGVRCRLSKVASRKERNHYDVPVSTIQFEAKLYCDCDENIVKGDKIEIDRGSRGEDTFIYYAGQPFYYSSHMEVPLINKTEI